MLRHQLTTGQLCRIVVKNWSSAWHPGQSCRTMPGMNVQQKGAWGHYASRETGPCQGSCEPAARSLASIGRRRQMGLGRACERRVRVLECTWQWQRQEVGRIERRWQLGGAGACRMPCRCPAAAALSQNRRRRNRRRGARVRRGAQVGRVAGRVHCRVSLQRRQQQRRQRAALRLRSFCAPSLHDTHVLQPPAPSHVGTGSTSLPAPCSSACKCRFCPKAVPGLPGSVLGCMQSCAHLR